MRHPLRLGVTFGLLALSAVLLASAGSSATSGVLYAAYGGSVAASDLYTVDPATAAISSVGPIGFSVTGLAVQPGTGTLYGVTAGGRGVSRNLLESWCVPQTGEPP